MLKPNKIVDISFLILFGVNALVTIYQGINNTFMLTINNYLAFMLYVIVVGLKFYSPVKGKYGVLILLGLSLVDITNFSAVVINSRIYHLDSGWSVNGIGFNIIVFVFLIAYCLLNGNFFLYVFKSLFVGSDNELADKKEKRVKFYYDKFHDESTQDFEKIYSNIKSYPDEAQIALKRLKQDRI